MLNLPESKYRCNGFQEILILQMPARVDSTPLDLFQSNLLLSLGLRLLRR